VLIVVSALLLGRALYIVHVRRRGSAWSRAIAWSAAVFVAAFWTWQLIS
jgi:hypothetical protein